VFENDLLIDIHTLKIKVFEKLTVFTTNSNTLKKDRCKPRVYQFKITNTALTCQQLL
jgi:ABC-type lipoprotein release transport system permease subunit